MFTKRSSLEHATNFCTLPPFAPSEGVPRTRHSEQPPRRSDVGFFVAVPFVGTLELSCRSSQLLIRIWTYTSTPVVPKSSSQFDGSSPVEGVITTAGLGGMRFPRYI